MSYINTLKGCDIRRTKTLFRWLRVTSYEKIIHKELMWCGQTRSRVPLNTPKLIISCLILYEIAGQLHFESKLWVTTLLQCVSLSLIVSLNFCYDMLPAYLQERLWECQSVYLPGVRVSGLSRTSSVIHISFSLTWWILTYFWTNASCSWTELATTIVISRTNF